MRVTHVVARAFGPLPVASPMYMNSPDAAKIQNDSALSRGNAMSRAPIISGTR